MACEHLSLQGGAYNIFAQNLSGRSNSSRKQMKLVSQECFISVGAPELLRKGSFYLQTLWLMG